MSSLFAREISFSACNDINRGPSALASAPPRGSGRAAFFH